jgi:hypothetical protein
VRIPALVTVGDVDVPVLIVNMGGGGLVVTPGPDLHRGELTVVKVHDDEQCYHLPAQVVWCARVADQLALGLSFIGLPMRPV